MPGMINHETLSTGRIIKAPVNYGYSIGWNESMQKSAVATTDSLLASTVPAGWIYIVEVGSFLNIARAHRIAVNILTGAVFECNLTDGTRVAAIWANIPIGGGVTLYAGEHIEAVFIGCVAGDDLRFAVHGRKIKLT